MYLCISAQSQVNRKKQVIFYIQIKRVVFVKLNFFKEIFLDLYQS